MRIMVTGGHGFYGRHAVRELERRGHSISALSHAEYDLRERSAIRQALWDWDPECVVHLAAKVGGISANAAAPAEFFYDNAIMGIQLMEESRLYGVDKFVTVGTVCEYPEHAQIPFREDRIWDGYPTPVTAPYALAKKALLVQAQAYREQYGFNSIHLIPVNLYGPEDNFDPETSHVVPGMIRRFDEAVALGSSTVAVWGTGRATREFIYVEDAARGLADATEKYNGAAPVNICSGEETTVAYLAHIIADLTGFDGLITWDTTRPDGQPRRALSPALAEAEFGFTASTPLPVGLARTVEWYREQR